MDSPGVVNSVVSLLRNKERRELEFALHLNETANRQQVQDRLVAIAIETGNSLVPRKKKHSTGKTAVFSQTSRNTKIKPPIHVLQERASISVTKHKNLSASQRFGLEGTSPAAVGNKGNSEKKKRRKCCFNFFSRH